MLFCTFQIIPMSIDMKTISSTLARQNFSDIITGVSTEEVTISKKNKDIAVIISSQRYKELTRLEDILYTKAAKLAIQEGLALVRKSIFNNPTAAQIISPGLNPTRSNPKPQTLNVRRFLKLVANNNIKHPALVQYYHDRGISDEIAKQYLREIHYLTTSGANMFAIGIPAGDGFEVSSSLGVGKAYVGEHARYTHLNIGATATVLVFEGFIDALSFISKYSEYANHAIIILNSTKHASAILSELEQYSTIELWLDKDSSGDVATDIISEAFPQQIQDMRTELNNFNDVNDWICGKKYIRS